MESLILVVCIIAIIYFVRSRSNSKKTANRRTSVRQEDGHKNKTTVGADSSAGSFYEAEPTVVAQTGNRCAKCGTILLSNSNFCPNCGEKVGKVPVVSYCINCGEKVVEGAQFCAKCGQRVASGSTHQRFTNNENLWNRKENPSVRKIVYEGYIHKCPMCGEALNAFIAVCPACGHEIRDVKSSTAVREFALKLEAISAQKMPPFEEKKSVMKMVFGRDFKSEDEDEARKALQQFEHQKNEEKASLIINFSVPNTKEDIMEFMILAASNINVEQGVDDIVTKAWISKLKQVYQRARLIMGNNPDFNVIKDIYDQKWLEIKNKKRKKRAPTAFGVGIYALLMSFLCFMSASPVAAIMLLIIGVVSLIVGIRFISAYHKMIDHNL